MTDLLGLLAPKERRGSKPRCHWLTHGPADQVTARLTALVAPWATVRPTDRWMPDGFTDVKEAQLHLAQRLLDPAIRKQLGTWWLPPDREDARSPNFDIASTCEIEGRDGLLLIEAKAHDEELIKEAAGRQITEDASEDRKASHLTIGAAIEAARAGLSLATSLPWAISHDSHYQMSNRFAWSWKLADLGIPVVLVYLGFLNADEMADRGRPFTAAEEWKELVLTHGKDLVPPEVWRKRWVVGGVPFISLIRAVEVPLDGGQLG